MVLFRRYVISGQVDQGDAVVQATQSQRSQFLWFAALAYAGAIAIAIVALLAAGESDPGRWLLVAPPLICAVVAVCTARRELVWTAIGALLALGIVSIFSIGIFMVQVAFCLLVWWNGSSRRGPRPVIVWSDLPWEGAGFLAVVLTLLAFG
jgi:hypothetical protein